MDKSVRDFNVRLRTIRIREVIAGVILAILLTTVLMEIFPIIYESEDLNFIVIMLIGALMFIWALRGTVGLDRNIEMLSDSNIRKEIFHVFATNFLFAVLITIIVDVLIMIYGFSDPSLIAISEIDSVSMDSSAIILDAIAGIVFAPIVEELAFRGVLFNRIKIRTGIIPAMIISSFIFAIGHEFGGMLSAFLFGICMCILYLKTDNILIPMSVHFINNLVVTVITLIGGDVLMYEMPGMVPVAVLSVIGSVYLIKYIIDELKEIRKQYG